MMSTSTPRAARALAPIFLVLASSACASHPSLAANSPPSQVSAAPSPSAPGGFQRSVFGHSVRGRDLVSFRVGPTDARRRILVVGVIHGNEAAARTIAQDLTRTAPPTSTEVVVVPDLNPDGAASGIRQNARGVDLNRNFAYHWTRLGHRGDQQYSGTAPLSEPESRAMASLIRALRPTVSVWFHQPVGVVDESGGSIAVESRFAKILGLPLQRLQRYPGSVASWENVSYRGTTAFVVELPRQVSASLRNRALKALRDLEQ